MVVVKPPELEKIDTDPLSSDSASELAQADSNSHQHGLTAAWWSFWCWVWMGASFGGAVLGCMFGVFISVVSIFEEPYAGLIFLPIVGIVVGGLWAAVAAAIVVPTVGILSWTCWLQKRPKLLAGFAGALSGAVAMPYLVALTAPFGFLE